MNTKLILTCFGSTFGTLKINEKSFLITFLGFTPYLVYKPTNPIFADSPGVYTSAKVLILSTINKTHLKSDVINGSIQNGLIQRIFFCFVLDKPSGYKVFAEPETINYKKIYSVLNTITFYLEDDNHEEFNFNGETLTFTLQLIKI